VLEYRLHAHLVPVAAAAATTTTAGGSSSSGGDGAGRGKGEAKHGALVEVLLLTAAGSAHKYRREVEGRER
jgi:hypothetical protein